MQTTNKKWMSTKELVFAAIMTAFVVVLQLMGGAALFGPFSTAVALVPIVIGAAMCGTRIGGWLGFVFGMVVLISGQASGFYIYAPAGTIITVLMKGLACGLVAGLVYRLLEKVNRYLAVVVAAILCPVANTGVFFLGCLLFFMKYAQEITGSPQTGFWAFFWFATGNFVYEVCLNLVLSPIIVRLINIRKKK